MSQANRNTTTTETSSRATTGQKLRGATEVMHGVGENIRGRFMNALDSDSGSGPHSHMTEQGRLEVERGMAKLTGGAGAQASQNPPATNPSNGALAGANANAQGEQYPGARQPPGSAPLAQERNVSGASNGPAGAPSQAQAQRSAGGYEGAGGPQAVQQGTNDRQSAYASGQDQREPTTVSQQGGNGGAEDRWAGQQGSNDRGSAHASGQGTVSTGQQGYTPNPYT